MKYNHIYKDRYTADFYAFMQNLDEKMYKMYIIYKNIRMKC